MEGFPVLDNFVSYSAYLVVLAVIFCYLSMNVSSTRRALKLNKRDSGDNPIMQRAIQAHTDFCHYVPFCLILLLIISQITLLIRVDIRSMSVITHVLFIMLITGRFCHLFGVLFMEARVKPTDTLRQAGSGLTLAVIMLGTLVLALNWIFSVAQSF